MNIDLTKKIVIITGASGTIGSALALGFAHEKAILCLLGPNMEKLNRVKDSISKNGGNAFCYSTDVLDQMQLDQVFKEIYRKHGKFDVLINCAGGNQEGATIMPNEEFTDLSEDGLQKVINLNLQGTILPSKVACSYFIKQGHGNIINISSMSAQRPMTRVVGYSAAKAGIDNFTKWLAVEKASKHGEKMRVNAIAPGFFLAKQNYTLLMDENGHLTKRGKQIIDHTPMKRFGNPEELVGPALLLASDLGRFITGTILEVDGGFNAYSGV